MTEYLYTVGSGLAPPVQVHLPGRGFGGRDRAVHGDWSGEVDEAAGATEPST